jgi:hypothetical protein
MANNALAIGSNGRGQTGVSAWEDIVGASGGSYHSIGLKSDGTCVAAGYNYYGQCDVGTWTGISKVYASWNHTAAVKSDGTCVADGSNTYGQINITAWTGITDLALGETHTIGLKSDGTCVAAGSNDFGEGSVGAWTGITKIAAGYRHTVGLKADGTCVATGENAQGECNVSGWTNIIAIAAKSARTVGLKSDGTCVAAGLNGDGEGDVSSWTNIKAIATGYFHTIGLKNDGTCVATGDNGDGQCDVDEWASVIGIGAGDDHTLAWTGPAGTPHEYEGGCLLPFSASGVLSKRIITPRSVTGRLRLWSPDRLTLFMETTAFNSLQITRRFVGNCLLEAYFPAYSEEAYYVMDGGWVEDDEGEWYRIHYRRATKDNVQLIAYGPHKVLSQRITVPASGQYGITVTGSADAVIKGLVSQTIANTGRDLPILVAAVRSGGTSISEISRYKNLAEEVERICYANDLGESFTFSATDFIFDTYAGTDRTRGNTAGNAPAIFSVRYDNLEDWAHAIASTDEVTTVYVAGQGTGTTRTMVIVGATTTGEDRFELFRDARDTNTTSILARRGAESVFPPAESFSAKANTSSNLTYNTDYALGDLVTIEIPERTATYDSATGLWNKVERYRSEDKRITEIARTYEGGAMDIDLVFGEAPKTRGDKQSEVQSNLSRLEAI